MVDRPIPLLWSSRLLPPISGEGALILQITLPPENCTLVLCHGDNTKFVSKCPLRKKLVMYEPHSQIECSNQLKTRPVLWSSQHAAVWQVVLLVVLFFIIIWGTMLC